MKKIRYIIISLILIFTLSSCEFDINNLLGGKYTISFDTLELCVNPAPIKNVNVIPEDLPTVKANGYTFSGWYYDDGFSSLALSGDKIHNDITLYALFVISGIGTPINPTPTVPGAEEPSNVKINILQMNDIHGHIEQNSNGKNGISNAAYLVNSIRSEDDYDNTLLVGNGDMFQETAISRLSYGEVVVECMNEMKFDFMGIGNHEFDWGIDKVFNYFDGDDSNGEADFPLINSNVYHNNKLVINDNIYESKIFEKDDVKIGVISLIGDVMGSINANMSIGYNFKAKSNEMVEIVTRLGKNLKDNNADIIVVNIHDGDSTGIRKYEPNNLIANIKYNNEYLVDVVINGHTHTKQTGTINRTGGVPMPVIQSSGSLQTFGRVDLVFDTVNKEVKSVTTSHVSVGSTSNYDSKVEEIVDSFYEKSKDVIEEVYCKNEAYISRYEDTLFNYAANLMMAGTGADAAIGNFGGFRNSVETGYLDFNKVYALNPFDNHIILCEIKGSDLIKFSNDNIEFNYCYTTDDSIISDKTYTLAVIDYVYFSYYFKNYRYSDYVDTLLEVRNLMIEDLRLRESFNINTDYDNVLITNMYN